MSYLQPSKNTETSSTLLTVFLPPLTVPPFHSHYRRHWRVTFPSLFLIIPVILPLHELNPSKSALDELHRSLAAAAALPHNVIIQLSNMVERLYQNNSAQSHYTNSISC